MSRRIWYEVRVREQTAPDTWVKKSKFYLAKSSREAASNYKGSGAILYSQKVDRERLLSTLGDELLRELRSSRGNKIREELGG